MAATIEEQIPDGVRQVCQSLHAAGHGAWLVGGCVRDLLMGGAASDWDLATSALPQEVQRLFRRTIPTGLQHGTVTVMHGDEGYEITTLRGDGTYSDGRRPDSVDFVTDIVEDLARRDFTVNAIAYEPVDRELVDPFDGLADLDARVIRAVRDARERFSEDGLRVLRAARFCATLEFALEPATRDAIPGCLDTFRRVSPERVHDEWTKAMTKAAEPSRAFVVMRETGILGITCPELAALSHERFLRAMQRVDAAPKTMELRMAALLADVETPKWARMWLASLKPSSHERIRIVHLLRHRALPALEQRSGPEVRKWAAEVGRDALDDVLALAEADGQDAATFRALIFSEVPSGLPLSTGELPVNGKDVMTALQIEPGRAVGRVLSRLVERVIEDPSVASRERLLDLIDEAYVEIERP